MRHNDIRSVLEIADTLDEVPRWAPDVYQRALDPLASPARVSLVAENVEASVVAYLITVVIPPHAELEIIAVSHPVRRQGIARHLMAALLKELRERHIARLMLEVRESNHPARMLYASLEFGETGRRPAYYSHPQEDAILLQRSLDPQPPAPAL